MLEVLDMLVATDGDMGYMHESFDVDDHHKFSRAWFAWSNSLFSEFVEKVVDLGLLG